MVALRLWMADCFILIYVGSIEVWWLSAYYVPASFFMGPRAFVAEFGQSGGAMTRSLGACLFCAFLLSCPSLIGLVPDDF